LNISYIRVACTEAAHGRTIVMGNAPAYLRGRCSPAHCCAHSRDRQRRIAFHFRRLAEARSGERRNEQEHRALRLLGARRRDRLHTLGVHAHEVTGSHRPHEPREVEYDTGVRQRDGPRDARAIIDIASDERPQSNPDLRGAHQAGYPRATSGRTRCTDKTAGADQNGC
jgi:hypothetical protein